MDMNLYKIKMMKLRSLIGILLTSTLFLACSSDDDGNTNSNPNDPNDPMGGTHLVKAEIGPTGTNIQYEYNEKDLLSVWTGTFPSFGYEIQATYNTDDNATLWEYVDSDDFTYSQGFFYDGQGRLTGYVGNTEDVTLTYNGNMVTATGTIEGDENASATLELDNLGRVIKFTESSQYSTLLYDANGNIETIVRYDLDDNIINEFSFLYDSNTNPYFGQMESVYLERFIEFFWEFDGIYFTGLEGYSFPYNRNNVLRVSKDGVNEITYIYGYDGDGFPTAVSEVILGDSFQYDITYY